MGEKTTFQESISDLLEENTIVMDRLAADWAVVQRIGSLSVPCILDNYEYEVERNLGYGFGISNNVSISKDAWKSINELPDEHPVAQYFHAPRRSRTDKLRDRAESTDKHLTEMAVFLHLRDDVHKMSGKDRAQRSVDAIYALDADDDTKQALHRSIDYWIYKEARHAPQFAKGFTLPDLASSEAAKFAMRGGLDRRVLKFALRDKEPSRKLAQELITQFASTDPAREAMLGHIALLINGRRSHSTGYYQPRITTAFTEQLLRDRYQKVRQRDREEFARRFAEHAEWFRKFREQCKQDFSQETFDDIFGKFTTGPSRIFDIDDPEKNLTVAIDNAHHTVRGTLLRMDRNLLINTVQKVRELRLSKPGITDRKIIAHFHHLGQLKDAAQEDIESAKAILLFATVTKGKQTTLSF